jgi:DNA topoisomerase-1
MSRKYSTSSTVVIVESPAKCKIIEKYLGPGYKVLASYGHLRELPSLQYVNVEDNFTPSFKVIDNDFKIRQIALLKKEIKSAGEVILATDDDREGESIAWHICEIFGLDLRKTKRITFNEITESAIQRALLSPRTVDMNVVHAQQARQILDLLVGFQVTPMLWKYIKRNAENSLSAGRCQTPALKIIYENHIEFKIEKQVFNTIGYFTNSNIPFVLNKKHETEDDMVSFLSDSADFNHVYNCTRPKKIYSTPPEPFTTSRIQQAASNQFHFSPKETMKICQSLYENGFITYMRTDSNAYSKEFIVSVNEYIIRTYNDDRYIRLETEQQEDVKKVIKESKNKTQEAHEAIRPTNISLCDLPSSVTDSKDRRLYKLIWENTLESCMSPASFFTVTANVSAVNNLNFAYTSSSIDFAGWKIVSKKNEQEIKKENKEYQYLQTVKPNLIIKYNKITSSISFTNTKSHYTEARLVQLLEEKGIGRPSTYSSLVEKIQERGYVKKEDIDGKEMICKDLELENDGEIYEIERKREHGGEKGKLVIQQLGIIVIEFLEKHFSSLFSYDYTKEMEDSLDKISNNSKVWYELCKECHHDVLSNISSLKSSDVSTKIEIPIDENNTYIIGKHGPIIKCLDEESNVTFKAVKKDIDINKIKNGDYELDEIVDSTSKNKTQYILGKYENDDVTIKKGKFGLYITWGKNTKTIKELGNRPMESIKFSDVEKYLVFGNGIVREVSTNISLRNSSKGNYIFYKTQKMKKPAFHSLSGFELNSEKCNIEDLKIWLKDTYNIS